MTAHDFVLLFVFLCSPNSADGQEPEPSDPSIEPVRPFCLEEEEIPTVTSSSPPQPDQSESTESGATLEERGPETRNLIELETTEESNNKTHEVKTSHTHTIAQVPSPVMCVKQFLDETDSGQKEAGFFVFSR